MIWIGKEDLCCVWGCGRKERGDVDCFGGEFFYGGREFGVGDK